MKQSAYLISLKEHCQPNGILSVIEENRTLPFAIRRCFFIYDLKPEDKRAVHAVNNQQCIFMLKGACDVMVHDGKQESVYHLEAPTQGIYIPPMFWREIRNCAPGSMLVVFSDQYYDPDAYIRDFDAFLRYREEVEE